MDMTDDELAAVLAEPELQPEPRPVEWPSEGGSYIRDPLTGALTRTLPNTEKE